MVTLNEHYLKLQAGYLFPEISRRVNAFCEKNPEAAKKLIRCGIGDVTEPLPEAVRLAIHAAVDEMGERESFRGYGPEQGYGFLREAIAAGAYQERGVSVDAEEIFVSDGSKCDTGNILDIFGAGNKIGVPDPVYPVYVDTNVMAGNTGDALASGAYGGLHYLPCVEGNGFIPQIPKEALDLVYLCFPNNPTGAVASREQLEAWVAYARKHGAILLYDAAYEAFITDEKIPRSIYEIEGAEECAIEFRSCSKSGGFTGVRCAWTVVPKKLMATLSDGAQHDLHSLWARRMSTKFNGVSYIVQRGAEALFSNEGKAQVQGLVTHYLENAALLKTACQKIGLTVYGGENAPYIWIKCPDGYDSWQVFDVLLEKAHVVITPGAGFGASGEGFFRISAFNSRENALEAGERLQALAW